MVPKLHKTLDSPAYSYATHYRAIVGSLQYLTFTWPDLGIMFDAYIRYSPKPEQK